MNDIFTDMNKSIQEFFEQADEFIQNRKECSK